MENCFKLVVCSSCQFQLATLLPHCAHSVLASQGLCSRRSRFLFKLSIHQLKHGTHSPNTHTHSIHTTHNTQVQLARRVQKRKHFDFLLVAHLNPQLNGGMPSVCAAYGAATGIIHLTRPHVHTHTQTWGRRANSFQPSLNKCTWFHSMLMYFSCPAPRHILLRCKHVHKRFP